MRLICFLIIIACGGVLASETVFLKDGRIIEGTVVHHGKYRIEVTQVGKVAVVWYFDMDKVERIETAEMTAERKRQQKEAEEARLAKVREERRAEEERLAAEREFTEKMKAEGRVLYNKQWVTPEQKEVEEARLAKERDERLAAEREFTEKMKAEGKIFYKGKWISLEEKEAAQEAERAKETQLALDKKEKAETAMNNFQAGQIKIWFQGLVKDGTICKVSDIGSTYWIKPIVWAVMNRDQKENCVHNLATYSQLTSGNKYVGGWAIVKSFGDDTTLGETTWLGGVEIYK